MDDPPILDAPWPPDLDPDAVPFRQRSVTIFRRMGFFDDWSLFSTLTEAEVLSWTNAGLKTVADIRTPATKRSVVIMRRRLSSDRLRADLAELAGEPWARHVWTSRPPVRRVPPEG